MSTSSIDSRGDLFQHFEHTIEGTYEELVEDQELEYGQNMLKSFLIESNIEPDQIQEFGDIQESRQVDYGLREVLFEYNSNSYRFFLDTSNERFWTFYTLEDSRDSKRIIRNLATKGVSNGLDYPWFPVQLQHEITEMGEFRDLGISYEADDVFQEDYVEEELGGLGNLSVQSSGGAERLLDALDEAEELRNFLSLSSVGIRREVGNSFVIERITGQGQFTTRGGDDIHLHLDTMEEIRDTYADLLYEIEDKYRMDYSSKEFGTGVTGEPLIIELSRDIDDLEQFVSNFISSKNPLRLWGAKSKLNQDYFKVKGIDLHNNDKFTLEIAPSWMRLYLDSEACGNTALRIYAHIQHHFDSEATIPMLEEI